MSSAIGSNWNLVSFVLCCPKRNPIRCVAIDFCSRQPQVAARLHIRVIRAIRGGSYLGFSSQSFWKRGSPRSGSNIGSSRSSAGVSGGTVLANAPS